MKDLYSELQSSSEKHFQKIFTKLMKKKYGHNYQGTQSYGNKGDRSVDGLLNNSVAFAIYAPEVYKDEYALRKIRSDYDGFEKQRKEGHWISVTQLIFVIKTERDGVTSDVLNLINNLNLDNNYLDITIWTMEDVYNIIEEFVLPKISYDVISNLCGNISFLNREYKRLNDIYVGLGKNSNVLFKDGMQSKGIQWYNDFVNIIIANQKISQIRFEYYNYFNDLELGDYIDKLVELNPPFYEDISTIYDCFESVADDEKLIKRSELCNKILEGLCDRKIVT